MICSVSSSHLMVKNLCNQLTQFSLNPFQTLQTYYGPVENVYVNFQ